MALEQNTKVKQTYNKGTHTTLLFKQVPEYRRHLALLAVPCSRKKSGKRRENWMTKANNFIPSFNTIGNWMVMRRTVWIAPCFMYHHNVIKRYLFRLYYSCLYALVQAVEHRSSVQSVEYNAGPAHYPNNNEIVGLLLLYKYIWTFYLSLSVYSRRPVTTRIDLTHLSLFNRSLSVCVCVF